MNDGDTETATLLLKTTSVVGKMMLAVLKCRFGKERKVTCTSDRRDGPGSGRKGRASGSLNLKINSPIRWEILICDAFGLDYLDFRDSVNSFVPTH